MSNAILKVEQRKGKSFLFLLLLRLLISPSFFGCSFREVRGPDTFLSRPSHSCLQTNRRYLIIDKNDRVTYLPLSFDHIPCSVRFFSFYFPLYFFGESFNMVFQRGFRPSRVAELSPSFLTGTDESRTDQRPRSTQFNI